MGEGGREEGSFLGGHAPDFARFFGGFWEEGVHLLRLDLELQTEGKTVYLSSRPWSIKCSGSPPPARPKGLPCADIFSVSG